jgi:hypothetical protein
MANTEKFGVIGLGEISSIEKWHRPREYSLRRVVRR